MSSNGENTKDWRETIKARADRDPEFRKGLAKEGITLEQAVETDVPKYISPTARASLARIRENVTAINRLERELSKSKWETVLIAFLVMIGLVWAGSTLVPIFV